MNSFTVAKFGGTSMGDATAMMKSAEIVRENSKIKLVVVSATSGTTNQLITVYKNATEKNLSTLSSQLEKIQQRHDLIAKHLESSSEEQGLLNELYAEMAQIVALIQQEESIETLIPGLTRSALPLQYSQPSRIQLLDQFLSIGERLSSVLFVSALRKLDLDAKHFDVRQVLVTDSCFGKAEPLIAEIAERSQRELLPRILQSSVTVVQGFIGSTSTSGSTGGATGDVTLTGQTTTLGRGGSDYSAALLAEGLEAEELQIWTDVPGIMTMDPNLVSSAKIIPQLSFDEAAELANFGAKVLHPATIWPAVRKKIRLFVGSTFQPKVGGTWIYPESENLPSIRAIALRKNQTLITITSLRMLNAHGFLAKLFGVLAKYRISVDLVTTSEVSVALTIDGASLGSSGDGLSQFPELLKELRDFSDVKIEDGLTLIAVIGNGLSEAAGLSGRTFNCISQFNIRMICHGASSHNLCFLVKQEEALEITQRLHREWIVPGHPEDCAKEYPKDRPKDYKEGKIA